MTLGQRVSIGTAVLLAASVSLAEAAPLSTLASDNATVQPAGPRSGGSGKAFFNIEGSANGTFASYGVADFDYGVLGNAVIAINSATLVLIQANAAFSTTGDVVFSLDQSAALVDIQPGGSSPLAFDGADPGTATDVGDGDLDLLSLGAGPYTYTVGLSGDANAYAFVVTPAIEAELISRLNSASPIRVVVGTGAASVAATWAGATNTTYTGPTLELDVTYDPTTPAVSSTWGKIKANYR